MDRIYASGAAGSAPSVPASPSSGYPSAGNPGTGTPATKPGPYWYHMVMEELMAIITAGGVTPAPGTLNQVKQALDALYAPKGAGSFKIQPIAASVASNALTVSLNPTSLDFRANTLSSGVVNTRTVGSTISLTIPSGATLGTLSGVAAMLLILAIDNAGTVELAVANVAGGLNFDESGVYSTTAISAASSNAGNIYSAVARLNAPYRVVGYIDITEATAGTWATAPTTVRGVGGQALAALSSVGYGQVNKIVSRASGTTYYNTNGKPIVVNIVITGNPTTTTVNVAGVNIYSNPGATANQNFCFVVPPGHSYSLTTTGTINTWSELR